MAMFGATVVLIGALLALAMSADSEMTIDNNEFLLYNKVYFKSRLCQIGTSATSFGTYDFGINDNQLWRFEQHPNKKGCYFIINEHYDYYRFSLKMGTGLVVYKGPYWDDQLFKLVPSGKKDDFYYITSCTYPDYRIAKKGPKDSQVGSSYGALNDNQLWKLVPRFKADVYTDEIFNYDNRQGTNPIPRSVIVTTGVVKSSEKSVSNTMSYSMAMESSLHGVTASAEFSQEIAESFTSSKEESWSKTESIDFTIPAGKNFKVMQHKVKFKGVIPQDTCTLMTKVKIFESDTATFSDPDKFIIE